LWPCGADWGGECSGAPTGTGFKQVAAEWGHSLAIKSTGTPPVPTPEFPTIFVPVMLIVGLAGVVLLARQKTNREFLKTHFFPTPEAVD